MSYIRSNPPIAENSLPLEWEHANDVDFTDEDEGVCKQKKDDVNKKGESLRGHEPWRKCVSLGSRLCSTEEIWRTFLLKRARKCGCRAPGLI